MQESIGRSPSLIDVTQLGNHGPDHANANPGKLKQSTVFVESSLYRVDNITHMEILQQVVLGKQFFPYQLKGTLHKNAIEILNFLSFIITTGVKQN